jgi:MYXO-CTERM domain-containing protein
MVSRPLSPTERRLHEQVRQLLPPDEELRAAVVISSGPAPGTEGWGAALAGLLGLFLVQRRRKYSTLAVTDCGVVRFRNSSARKPAVPLHRYEVGDPRVVSGTWGDSWVELAGTRYGVEGVWANELAKIRRFSNEEQ